MSRFRQIHGLAIRKSPGILFLVLFVAEWDPTLTESYSGMFPTLWALITFTFWEISSSANENGRPAFSHAQIMSCAVGVTKALIFCMFLKCNFQSDLWTKAVSFKLPSPSLTATDTPEHQSGEIFPVSLAQMCSLRVCWGFWDLFHVYNHLCLRNNDRK